LKNGRRILTPAGVARAARTACLLDVVAEKPGNVSLIHSFSDATWTDFALSAFAIGPAMACAGFTSVGDTVLRAVRDTRRLVKTNTNLGIILLLAPLGKAYGRGDLRQSLGQVIRRLTVADARKVYAAINLASPGGLGRVRRGDVSQRPGMTLREAMFLARDRDSIAREYVTDFEIVFSLGYPCLRRYCRENIDIEQVVVQTYLEILARVPDTLVARKAGWEAAFDISRRAVKIVDLGGVFNRKGREAIREFDGDLRKGGNLLNPGTTADLTVVSLFVAFLEETVFL